MTSFLNSLHLDAKACQWDGPCCKITGHPTMQRELLALHCVYPLRKMHILCFELHSPHYFNLPFSFTCMLCTFVLPSCVLSKMLSYFKRCRFPTLVEKPQFKSFLYSMTRSCREIPGGSHIVAYCILQQSSGSTLGNGGT